MAKDVENPCTSNCKLSDGVCRGCGRSKEEIKSWKSLKRPDKAAVVKRAHERMKAMKGKKKK
ncbi:MULTISPECIES: DUF1289 domain-containing protein [Pseudomonas]|uniref:DUF1289 domain-containing protein n=1 Tax=Pseudomonas quercus TaxID=2722792 RepID=A0ABX0YAQ7_9PSED|nr:MULTISPECIES: DUF1289 domain-containing protein [Pseudomonas]MBF7140799.1 DUF1289 domain-containing protein [Pseudomonas sp. LY10J]NJO99335.1 DUF1289 domain-containing protein [Pseudomonas quercus]